jgi:vesicle-fusing ATPase
MPDGQFGASALQKDMLRISKIDTSPLQITKARDLVQNPISQIEFILELIKADASTLVGSIVELNVDELGEAMRQVYDGKIINLLEQAAIVMRNGALIIKCTVQRLDSMKPSNLTYGQMVEDTVFKAVPSESNKAKIRVMGSDTNNKQLFKTNFNFETLGIGGLDKEFAEIFRRAFNSRRYP